MSRLLVVSPVRNEAAHFERVARAMAAQTRPPDTWIVVDDGSKDGTAELVAELAREIPFMVAAQAPQRTGQTATRDRLAAAAAPRTFNAGLGTVDRSEYTHISKLDGDMELPPHYYERLLEEFAADPGLGIAGGRYTELVHGEPRLKQIPLDYHVSGALKCYTADCFRAIGGISERLGWDTIDETYARMKGFRTRTIAEGIVAVHHRAWGSADGTMRGRARYGTTAYILRFPLWWILVRSLKMATSPPEGLSGLAFLYGYARAAFTRVAKVEDPSYREFLRGECRARARGALQSGRLRVAWTS
jgi:poly-beta-1,6-N-acetyl-D-glucosamine synthase